MASENPDHQAIDRLGGRQHERRMAEFAHVTIRGSHPAAPERDATNRDRLEWARRDYTYGKDDEVIAVATRVVRSPDASPRQRAEAYRLRAVAHANKRFYAAAVEDAEDALGLDPDAEGVVGAADLRELLGHWRRIVTESG